MKAAVKRIIRDEKGRALELALILLLVGGLTSASLLGYMGSGLVAGEVYEMRTAELYAADAGVEDAVWKIEHGEVALCPGDPTHSYNMTDVNGKSVDVTISSFYGVGNITLTYRVESTATGDGSGTEIEAYIVGVNKYGDYAGLLGNVLTSQNEINLQPGANVTPSEGEHSPAENYLGPWTKLWELEEFYGEDVAGEESYGSDLMILNGDTELGPFYRDGDLEIKSGTVGITVTLTGTVYISGDTLIGGHDQDFTLDLNGQTIFVASNSSDPQKALWIGGKCTVEGTGVIIAVGDIYFEPHIEVGMTNPIFIFSISGITNLQPGGNFYGAIAGSVEVNLQPDASVNYPENDGWYDNLNFLIGIKKLIFHIASWEVSAL